MTSKFKIGLIGAGKMGAGLGQTLLREGYRLGVMAHKNREPIEALIDSGAIEFGSIADMIAASDVMLTCLPGPTEVRQTIGTILDHPQKDLLIIDTSSSDPVLTKELAIQAEYQGMHLVDAPLLGGPKLAREGNIGTVAGGTPEAIKVAKPILHDFARTVVLSGGPGTGHTTKLLNNAVTLSNSAIIYETFAVAKKLGVDYEMLYQVLDASAASSKRLHDIAPRLINDDDTVSFALDVATKDLVLYSEMAGRSGVPILVGEASKQQYRLGQSMGFGAENVTVLSTMLYQIAAMNNS